MIHDPLQLEHNISFFLSHFNLKIIDTCKHNISLQNLLFEDNRPYSKAAKRYKRKRYESPLDEGYAAILNHPLEAPVLIDVPVSPVSPSKSRCPVDLQLRLRKLRAVALARILSLPLSGPFSWQWTTQFKKT